MTAEGYLRRDVLEVLQERGGGTSACPKLRLEEWYRPHLGTFLDVDKDGFLCQEKYDDINSTKLDNSAKGVSSSTLGHPPGDETQIDNSGSSDIWPLMGDILWPNHGGETDSENHTSQSLHMADGLVPLSPFVLQI